MLRVKQVKYMSEYKLKIFFSDGKTKIVDFQNWINVDDFYFLPMRDIEFFKQVRLDESNYSICWPNGVDVSPDVLYGMGIQDTENEPNAETKKAIKDIEENKNLTRYKSIDDFWVDMGLDTF